LNRLKEIRLAKGLNQRELSEKVHTAQSLICRIECNELKPWPKLRRRLAKVLGVTINELFPIEEGRQNGPK
jgi:putative transcriptional regulator